MLDKRLKHLDFLSQIENCPSDDYVEINANVYRWIHAEKNENDFKPLNLIKSPPQRLIDDSDLMCMGYGLSMFDSLENAVSKYRDLHRNKRANQKRIFVEDKGTMVANLQVTEEDGIANTPHKTNYGHFTFYEYEDKNLSGKIVDAYNIFKENGEYNG
jgi:hypothetical protein